METRFLEATNGFNYGKFMVARFTAEEWQRRGKVDGLTVLSARGWSPDHVLVLDLETGEGAIFLPKRRLNAHFDLKKHKIWVCPMFEPFLAKLYEMDLSDLSKLPDVVELTEEDAPSAFWGYRRPGPDGVKSP